MPRKKFEPTPELRQKVKSLVGFGVPQKQICALIGIRSVNTLRRHFPEELSRGPLEALAKVQQTAFRLAMSGRNPRMTRRWLERRGRWAPGMRSRPEVNRVTHTKWIIEEYQPPIPDDDPRHELLQNLARPQHRNGWENDDGL